MSAKSRALLEVLVLLSICYFLFFFRMGARDLWNPDEPRYAQVAREMLESGEWVVPHLNGEIYTEKPPLYFWLVALASKPFGDVTEVTARLPSALAATLIVLLTYFLGGRMFDRRLAIMGAVIMATSTEFFVIGRSGVIDSVLTLCILAALGTFFVGYSEKKPILYSAGFLFLAPAVLSKGPVGIAVPVLVMLTFLSVETCLHKDLGRRQMALFLVGAILGTAIVALVVVPWWRSAYVRSDGAYGSMTILMKQTEGRLFESYSHRRPFYYYFGEIVWQFMPWTVFLPLTIRRVRKNGDLRRNLGLRFLVVWFLSVFVLFTFISGKRSQYLLPLFPPGGLILAWVLHKSNMTEGQLRNRWVFSIPLLLLLLLSAAGLVGITTAAYWYERAYFWATATAAFASAVVLIVLARRSLNSAPKTALAGVAVVTTIFVAVTFGYIAPFVDKYKSARPFCSRVLAALDSDDALFFYDEYRPNVHYYMQHRMPRLESNEEVLDALERSPAIFLVMESSRRPLLNLNAAYEIEQITQAHVGSRELACVAVRPAEPHR